MNIENAIKDYLIEIEIRKYTPKTIKGHRTSLNLFLCFCEGEMHISDMEKATSAVVKKYAGYMSQNGRKGTYVNGLLKSLKSFAQYCYEEGSDGFNAKHNFKWCKEEKTVRSAVLRTAKYASKPVSRVLSFKTAIYLDAPLPIRSSRLPGTVGPTICPSTALLRIEFTATDAWHAVG